MISSLLLPDGKNKKVNKKVMKVFSFQYDVNVVLYLYIYKNIMRGIVLCE